MDLKRYGYNGQYTIRASADGDTTRFDYILDIAGKKVTVTRYSPTQEFLDNGLQATITDHLEYIRKQFKLNIARY